MVVSGKRLVKALGKAGFRVVHVRGSHHYLRKGDGPLVCVPVHGNRDLPKGTLGSILRQAGISKAELARLL